MNRCNARLFRAIDLRVIGSYLKSLLLATACAYVATGYSQTLCIPEGAIHLWPRILLKARVIASFFGNTRTPIALTIDSLNLKRRPLVAVSADGIKLRLNPSCGESFTFYENLVRRDYLANGISLRPGDTVVDIGANIGSFTVLAAKVVGPGGRVISFEPVAETFARLEENVALNGYGNVECRRAAIDDQEGTLTLVVDPKSAWSGAYSDLGGNRSTITQTAPCLTLERVFRDHDLRRINLLKVDCEGSEYGIFESLSRDLAARIDQIAMEVHPIESRSGEQLRENLRALGFDVRPYPYCWVAFNSAVKSAGPRVDEPAETPMTLPEIRS